jgi:hypothetical protein
VCLSGAFYPTFTFCERPRELVCAEAAKCKRVAAIFPIPSFEKQFQAQSISIIAGSRSKNRLIPQLNGKVQLKSKFKKLQPNLRNTLGSASSRTLGSSSLCRMTFFGSAALHHAHVHGG